MNTYFCATLSTPCGPFSLCVDATGALVATAFGDTTALHGRLKSCQRLDANFSVGATEGATSYHLIGDKCRVAPWVEEVRAYFAEERRDFDLPLAAIGSAFQQRVWSALRSIPFGETRSYGDLARALGTAPRAVGRANATNPICLIVPCHRVIGADGSLTGFAFGENIKRQLLEHERSVAMAPARTLAATG